MNFIFVSPHFPENYQNFCIQLKADGVNVLGIGDAPYDSISGELREALTEYYRVENMENYDEMYRAVAFFCFKYGKIGGLESNNEYWLEQDARLRTDFNIPGMKTQDISRVKRKSQMKKFYEEAGVPSARFHLVDDEKGCLDFIAEVGYPVIVKPDSGVGAVNTFKLSSDEELRDFLSEDFGGQQFIMEEFVPGEIFSYDAIIDSHGEPLLETGNHTPVSIMDIVNDHLSTVFYIEKRIADDIRETGRRCVKTFGVKSRFIHFEFFRLTRDHDYLGKKGTIVGLEVNLRPSGGYTPDMIDFACSTDVYKDWADMIVYDKLTLEDSADKYYCVSAGLRSSRVYLHSPEQVMDRYGGNIMMVEHLPEVLAQGMGDLLYIARFSEKDEMDQFISYVCRERNRIAVWKSGRN